MTNVADVQGSGPRVSGASGAAGDSAASPAAPAASGGGENILWSYGKNIYCICGRYRLLTQTSEQGLGCQGDNKEVSPCPYYPCPAPAPAPAPPPEAPRSSGKYAGVKRLLGEFRSTLHGVAGRVYLTPKQVTRL